MYLTDCKKIAKQRTTLPSGYEIVYSGAIQEGDIRWNCLDDCWNITDITRSPKHDIILGDPVRNFHGVCRLSHLIQIESADFIEDNPLNKPQYIEL